MEESREPYFTTEDLAERWQMTPHALEQWRWRGHGPCFFKFGKRVLYLQEEIARFEEWANQVTVADINDPRFACIKLGKKKEETPMGP